MVRPQHKPSLSEVKSRYEAIRVKARKNTLAGLPSIIKNGKGQSILVSGEIELAGIDTEAKRQASQWENSPLRRDGVKWSWGASEGYKSANPKFFEVAIWHKSWQLCGLSLGKPTKSGSKLCLDFIEASPEDHPLKGVVTDIVILNAEAYADLIGATQLRIINPINDKVRNHYLRPDRGFSYDTKGNFCFRDL